MIKMQELKDLIKYTIYSGYIKDERPVSIIIIANPESGKTEALEQFKYNNGLLYINDTTPFGIVKEMHKLTSLNKPLKHIIIPDLLNPLSKSKPSVKGLIHFLNTVTEEGLTKIETAGIQFDIPLIRCGLIGAITSIGFKQRIPYWKGVGFLSRMLPFTYKYDINTVQEIINSIFAEEYKKEDSIKLKLPNHEIEIKSKPEYNRELLPYTLRLANAQETYGFRLQKHYQRLLKASALANGRKEVTHEDINNIKKIAKYTNLEFNTIE